LKFPGCFRMLMIRFHGHREIPADAIPYLADYKPWVVKKAYR
jgi:hypothetical protein